MTDLDFKQRIRQGRDLVPDSSSSVTELDLLDMPATRIPTSFSRDHLNVINQYGPDSALTREALNRSRQFEELRRDQQELRAALQPITLEKRIIEAVERLEREDNKPKTQAKANGLITIILRPAFAEQVAEITSPIKAPAKAPAKAPVIAPAMAKVLPVAGKLAVDASYIIGRGVWTIFRAAEAQPRTACIFAGLAGLGWLVGQLEPAKPGSSWLPDISLSTSTDEILPPLKLPHTELQVNEGLSAVNDLRFALRGPIQKKKISAVLSVEKEIATFATQIRKQPTAHLLAQLKTKEQELAALPQPIPNDKLSAAVGAKWAIIALHQPDNKALLPSMTAMELFGFYMAKTRIESGFDPSAEFTGVQFADHARGVIQLQTPTYLSLLIRHHDKLQPLGSEAQAFDKLKATMLRVMYAYVDGHPELAQQELTDGTIKTLSRDQAFTSLGYREKHMKAALNAADPADQKLIRDALVDSTPMDFFGETTTRGAYLSYFLAAPLLKEMPITPQPLIAKIGKGKADAYMTNLRQTYGSTVFGYTFWQMPPQRYNNLITDTYALDHYSENAATAALNRAGIAKSDRDKGQAAVIANLRQQIANQIRYQALQPRRRKGQKKLPAQSAVAKKTQAQLVANQKQLKANQVKLQKQQRQLNIAYAAAQKRYQVLHKPEADYNAHISAQAVNNPMWKAPNGNYRYPRQLYTYVRDSLIKGIDTDTQKLWANWGQPVIDFGIGKGNLARMPSLTTVKGNLVYKAPETVIALRPTSTRVSIASTLQPSA